MKTQWSLQVDAVSECVVAARGDGLRGKALTQEIRRLSAEHNLSSAAILAGIARGNRRFRKEARS